MIENEKESEKEIYHRKLVGSLLYFTQIFYYLRTGRKFELTYPDGRESHLISICRALTKVIDGNSRRLLINVPPRYGKTELLINFVAWSMGIYPDSNSLYVSYSHSLAAKQTQTIKRILQMNEYRDFFNVLLRSDSSAKDNFETVQGGSVYAAGAGGSITGRGAGIMGANRFGGCIVIDDIHKPDEVTSDTMRQSVIDWYDETLSSRVNSPDTPIIFIGQRLHEDDLANKLIESGDYETLIIPALDVAGNVLHPRMHDRVALEKMRVEMPYVYSSQYQQTPQPAGGGLFKKDWFPVLDEEPEILVTFVTADTAETEKSYNDATVFSFWGLYKIQFRGFDVEEMYGLHWIDCLETRIEPKDIEETFLDFYSGCMRHKVKPQLAAIEKKSTGVTLISSVNKIQGIKVVPIERAGVGNSKTNRFLEIQPYIASKRITLPVYGKHTKMCIDHMAKITANETHRWDDIADTCSDAVKIGLIDKTIINKQLPQTDYNAVGKSIMSGYNKIDQLKKSAFSR